MATKKKLQETGLEAAGTALVAAGIIAFQSAADPVSQAISLGMCVLGVGAYFVKYHYRT